MMEFFTCPCACKGKVILDGNDQGENKNENDDLLVKQCGRGLHQIALECVDGKQCLDSPRVVMIKKTNPINPLEVPFQCGS